MKKKAPIKLANLVVLMFAPNPCCVQVAEGIPKKITIDLEKGTWRYVPARDYSLKDQPNGWPIGEGRYIEYRSSGEVIGVYDPTNIDHLNKMVSDVVSATRGSGSGLARLP